MQNKFCNYHFQLFHRDVAARNVVLTEGFVAKLCDFGYACTQEESNNGYMEMDKVNLLIIY